VEFTPVDLKASEPYWRMTKQVIEGFDAIQVPKDWSSASYPIALAILRGESVSLPDLRPDDLQADAFFGHWCQRRGALEFSPSGALTRKLVDLSPLQVDVAQCLDLAPTLAVVAAHLQGESQLTGVEGLRAKESDRLEGIRNLIQQFGVKTNFREDTLLIQGGVTQKPESVKVEPDHRMVMAASVMLALHGGGEVEHADCVAKSFPEFFKKLGLTD
jgi:3-phosphoshikimate 1-carboxyvinyltransferase